MRAPWLEAVVGHYGTPLRTPECRPLTGGYVSGDVWQVVVELPEGPTAVVWKRSTAREVAALRAVAEVPGLGSASLIAASPDRTPAAGAARDGASPDRADESWVLVPHHPGTPLLDGQPVPPAALEALARVHAHYLDRPPPGVPVVDAGFWRRLCLDSALPAVRGAAARGSHPGYARAEESLLAWAYDPRMRAALAILPATLAHGDMHRGNILATPDGGCAIIDWGNARIAPGGLDLAVLAEQGGVHEDSYLRLLAELSGRPQRPELRAVEREWALAFGYVQYLGFAADHLGGDRVGVMIDLAAAALDRLGPALDAR